MITFADEQRRNPWEGWRPWLVALAIYAVVLSIYLPFRAETGTDFRDFWQTAKEFRETGNLSADLGVHNYLPFFTFFMLPWSVFPLQVAIVLFSLLSLALFATTVLLTEIMLHDGLPPKPRPATLMALGLMLPYIISCNILGQLALLLVFLIVVGWFLVVRGQEWEAGIAFGLAALIKIFPVVLVGFLFLKGRWRAGVSAIAVMIALGLGGTLAALGWERTVTQHREFVERAVVDHSAKATIFAEKPIKAKYNNNALPMVLRRLLSPVDYDPAEGRAAKTINFVSLPSSAIWLIYLGVAAGAITLAIAAIVRSRGIWPPRDLDQLCALQAQFGAWCCLMLVLTPLFWTHYLPVLYWPLAFLADRADRYRRAEQRVHPFTTLMLLLWLAGVLALASDAARAAGAQLLSAIALFAGCVYWAWHCGGTREMPPAQRVQHRLKSAEDARKSPWETEAPAERSPICDLYLASGLKTRPTGCCAGGLITGPAGSRRGWEGEAPAEPLRAIPQMESKLLLLGSVFLMTARRELRPPKGIVTCLDNEPSWNETCRNLTGGRRT
ncbi:MAG: glycosyltransferase family 87 protein [Phycisphaerae bacterium]